MIGFLQSCDPKWGSRPVKIMLESAMQKNSYKSKFKRNWFIDIRKLDIRKLVNVEGFFPFCFLFLDTVTKVPTICSLHLEQNEQSIRNIFLNKCSMILHFIMISLELFKQNKNKTKQNT